MSKAVIVALIGAAAAIIAAYISTLKDDKSTFNVEHVNGSNVTITTHSNNTLQPNDKQAEAILKASETIKTIDKKLNQ